MGRDSSNRNEDHIRSSFLTMDMTSLFAVILHLRIIRPCNYVYDLLSVQYEHKNIL